jgi:hypothetical protein
VQGRIFPALEELLKRLFCIFAICTVAASLHSQAVDTSVCDILKDPQSFNGKTVRIKGTVSSGFDEFIIRGEECHHAINSIWLAYPEGTKAKSGPAAMLQLQPASNFGGTVTPVDRAPVVLDKSKDFKQFDSLLAAQYKSNGMCLGCAKNEVSATLTGRLDAVQPALDRDASGKIIRIQGFGNLNAWPARLVLQSVADVSPHQIDYSKSAAVTKDEVSPDLVGGDAVTAARSLVKLWDAGNPSGVQLERAVAVFGKQGQDNGVSVGFSGGNEAVAAMEQKSEHSSPDGVLYHCTFDSGRLKNNALTAAIAHVGEHVANLRDPQNPAPDLIAQENKAWVSAALAAIGERQKSLTIPGGYIIWNAAWPPADINKLSGDALQEFFTKEALLGQ